jgi:hypothetical protein
MKRVAAEDGLPEMIGYTKYYEHDGMLRAYANRAMVLAFMFGAVAVGSLGFAIYVRLQPPTIIRVDRNGDASVVGASGTRDRSGGLSFFAVAAADANPTEIEAKAVVRRFLEHYLVYTPATVDRNLAESLNMMTANLRMYTMNKLRDEDTVGKIKEDRIISNFRIRSIEPVKDSPLTYIAFGVKEIHRVRNRVEATDRIVGRYNVRLVQDRRSEFNASGLLVAEYWEQQMVGDRNTDLLQQSDLER